jgi:hypothetical protein
VARDNSQDTDKRISLKYTVETKYPQQILGEGQKGSLGLFQKGTDPVHKGSALLACQLPEASPS